LNARELVLSSVALIVFASAYTLIRIALTELPPLTVGALRFVLASTLIVPLAFFLPSQKRFHFDRRDMPVLVGLSVVQIFVPNFLQNVGMEYTTAAVSSVLQSTTPVFTLVLAFVFLRERVGWQQIVGVIVAMTGVALLSTGGDLSNLARSQLAGNLMQVAVAASYGFSGLMGKRLLRKYPPLQVVALTFVLGGVLLTAVAIFFERSDWPMSLSFEVIVALVLLSFLYCIGLVSWYSVLKTTGVFRLYVLLFIMPVLAVAISIIVLRENFTMLDVLFSAITLLGVGITEFRMDRWRRSSSTPP